MYLKKKKLNENYILSTFCLLRIIIEVYLHLVSSHCVNIFSLNKKLFRVGIDKLVCRVEIFFKNNYIYSPWQYNITW